MELAVGARMEGWNSGEVLGRDAKKRSKTTRRKEAWRIRVKFTTCFTLVLCDHDEGRPVLPGTRDRTGFPRKTRVEA